MRLNIAYGFLWASASAICLTAGAAVYLKGHLSGEISTGMALGAIALLILGACAACVCVYEICDVIISRESDRLIEAMMDRLDITDRRSLKRPHDSSSNDD